MLLNGPREILLDVIPGEKFALPGNLGPGHKAPPLCVFLGRGLAR